MTAVLATGATYRDLGEALGIDPGAARMRAKRAGLRSLHRHRPPNSETTRRIQVARSLLADGREIGDVTERLGMSAAAVRMMLRRAGP